MNYDHDKQEKTMRTIPTIITDGISNNAIDVPVAEEGKLERAIDLLVGGNLTTDEQIFVEKASKHNWTIRVIIDELRKRRNMVAVPLKFNWRVI